MDSLGAGRGVVALWGQDPEGKGGWPGKTCCLSSVHPVGETKEEATLTALGGSSPIWWGRQMSAEAEEGRTRDTRHSRG